MNLNVLIPLVAFVVYGALLFVVIRQHSRSKVNRTFALYLLAMTVWSFGSFMMHADFPVRTPLFWNKFMGIGILAMPTVFFYFVQAFLNNVEERRRWLYLGLVSYLALLTANVMGYGMREAYVLDGVLHYEFGPAVPFIALNWYFFAGFSTFDLIRRYKRSKDEFYRNRIGYPLMGISMVVLGTFTNFTPLGKYPVDITANVINALLIAYAIRRYQLLDITVVVRKGLLYSIPTVIIGAGYFLIVSLVMRLFQAFAGPQILLLSLLVAAITAVVAQPLRDRAQLGIDRLFFREKYDSSLMLQRLSRASASVLDLDRLTGMILDEVTTTIHIERAAFFVRQEESGGFRLIAQKGLEWNDDWRLRKDHPIVDWLSGHESALTRRDMEVMPQFKALWGEEREDLERMGRELFIPLEAKGELVGILAVGPKLSEAAYSQDDQLTLTTLANQVAIAIQNARLYNVAKQEITERKRAEVELKEYSERLEEMVEERTEELQYAHARLIQSEKLAATGRLAASVAHEVNNPLQGISNYLYLISQRVAGDDPLHKDLDMVKLGFDRIAEIVRRLRAFYSPAGEGMEPTDVNGVVERVLALVGHQFSLGNVKVKTELAEQELQVLGSAGQLEQVLINLALNAQEAMPQGGELMVRTTRRDNVVQLRVSDTGHGMSEEEMGELFKPFYGGKGGTGLGLGLWISHNIIEGHGGSIEVESQVGEGTTFTISLPAYQRER